MDESFLVYLPCFFQVGGGTRKGIRVDKQPVGECPKGKMEEFQSNRGGAGTPITYSHLEIELGTSVGAAETVGRRGWRFVGLTDCIPKASLLVNEFCLDKPVI